MRAAVLLVFAACTPEIGSGTYLCGTDSTCPPTMVCGGDAVCVLPGADVPFACEPGELHEPDDDIGHALALTGFDCVSVPRELPGCLAAGNPENWVAFDAPTTCTAVEVVIRLAFPIAFEAVSAEITDASGAMLAEDAPCSDATPAQLSGTAQRCAKLTLAGGARYGIRVAPTGDGDCGGACNFNRYQLTVSLDTP
jgi:hypothetical protein